MSSEREGAERVGFVAVCRCGCGRPGCAGFWVMSGYADDGIARQRFVVPDLASLRYLAEVLATAVGEAEAQGTPGVH